MSESPLEKIRKAAGWSRDRAAVEARVSYAICRLYEACPGAIVRTDVRTRLDSTYAIIGAEAARVSK